MEFLVGLATSLLFDSCLTWMNILIKVPLHGTGIVFAMTGGLFHCSMQNTIQGDVYELGFCDWLIFLELNRLNLYDLIHSQYISSNLFLDAAPSRWLSGYFGPHFTNLNGQI